jgi:hypothetical protein
VAQVELRLSADQFFRLTPRQLHILMDRYRECVQHREWMTGLLCSTVANWSMGAPKTPLRPSDFLPSLAKIKPRRKRERLNRPKIANDLRSFLMARMDEQKPRTVKP